MQRLKELDTMKTIGILLVVLGHITMAYTTRDVINLGSFSLIMEKITEYIYMFHMPAFVASSGAIYFFGKRIKGKYANQASFVRGKMMRLLVPYFFFLVIIMLPIRSFIGIEEELADFIVKFIFLMIGPHHLWYVVMIFNIYVLFNLFEERVNKSNFFWMLIFFILLNILGEYIPNIFQIGNTLKYLLYFYLGYSFQRNKDKVKISKNIELSIVVSLILSLIMFYLMQINLIQNSAVFYYITKLIGAFTGIAMLYHISVCLSSFSIVNNKITKRVEKDSFAIYLFHQGFVYIIVFLMTGNNFNPYLFTFILFVITIVVSSILTKIMRKLNLNIFIGEK